MTDSIFDLVRITWLGKQCCQVLRTDENSRIIRFYSPVIKFAKEEKCPN
jgi:hypothetical protein